MRVGLDPQGQGLCYSTAGATTHGNERELVLRAGQIRSFRLGLDFDGKLGLFRTD